MLHDPFNVGDKRAPSFQEAFQRGQQYTAFLKWCMNTIGALSWFIGLQGEVLLRYKFGERYVGTLPALIGVGFAALVSITFFDQAARRAMAWFLITFIIVFAAQQELARRRRRNGELWHSYSEGLSWPIWKLTPGLKSESSIVARALEPGLVTLSGIAVELILGSQFGWWVTIVGISIFIKREVANAKTMAATLDLIDARIEGESQQNATHNFDTSSTKGRAVLDNLVWQYAATYGGSKS